MKLELKDIPAKFAPYLAKLRRYTILLFILSIMLIYGLLVFRINTLMGAEPSDEAVAEKLNTVKRPKIDQAAIDKMKQLEGQNVEVQSLFKQARDNPFSE